MGLLPSVRDVSSSHGFGIFNLAPLLECNQLQSATIVADSRRRGELRLATRAIGPTTLLCWRGRSNQFLGSEPRLLEKFRDLILKQRAPLLLGLRGSRIRRWTKRAAGVPELQEDCLGKGAEP